MFSFNTQRLRDIFIELCEIDSPSQSEKLLAQKVCSCFQQLGANEILEDDSAPTTGSNSGNYIIRFTGTPSRGESIFFNCHLDVVSPCLGVKVKEVGGLFTSASDTVLGSDDKAGIALLIETVSTLRENGITHRPFEIVLTTCEEIGLLGARSFSADLLNSHYGYSLDSTGTDNIIVGAPASHSIDIDIFGRAAHAGLHPENGINAIQLAGKALARFPTGRLDPESTANIGLIKGGQATNIVPEHVSIQGEIRSHSREALDQYLSIYAQVLDEEVVNTGITPTNVGSPSFSFRHPEQYPLMDISETHPAIQNALQAARSLGRSLDIFRTGGGSDANFFNYFGLTTAILGIGMDHVHSTEEQIRLADMIRTAELVGALLVND